jgi:hypothetical protein
VQGGQGDPQEDAEAEAAVTSIAIAGLRRRLRRPRVLDHPMVRREMRKLIEDALAAFNEPDAPSSGRHRASRAQAAEPGSLELKPDPASARTARELIEVLGRYKVWSGDLPWRAVAARARQKRVASTICEAMKRDVLPTRGVIEAIITGCGGSQDDLDAFIAAWQRISATSTRVRRKNPALSRPLCQRQATKPGQTSRPARRPRDDGSSTA